MTMTTIKLPCHPRVRPLIASVSSLIASVRFLIAGCAVALAVLAGGVSPLQAQSVAVMVNGEPITNYDIDQRGKLNFLTSRKPAVRQDLRDLKAFYKKYENPFEPPCFKKRTYRWVN